LVHARIGDHAYIHQLLLAIFHGPSASEFHARHDEPDYDPTDRLLIKRDERILAHVHLMRRVMYFNALRIPVGLVTDLAVLPEYRGQGYAARLLAAAERQMIEDGAAVGLLRTTQPGFFRGQGWTVCGRHCYSSAGTRAILAQLDAMRASEEKVLLRCERPLSIRLWRHVEQDALMHLFKRGLANVSGVFRRSDDRWRWLISRRAYDRIYVAIDGPNDFALGEADSRIVGYAVVRGDRVVEIVASKEHPRAVSALLARVCGDAIERDDHVIRLDAPPLDPLHPLVRSAGGRHCHRERDRGEVFMMKLFDPIRMLASLCPVLHARAKAGALPCPFELGMWIGRDKYCLVFSRRKARLVPGKLGRSHLAIGQDELTQLLFGHLDPQDAAAADRIEISTQVAFDAAQRLFPRRPLWHPPWDDLPA